MSTKLGGFVPNCSQLERAIGQIGETIRRDFGDEMARDPAGFKKQAVWLFRRELPPRPGRPNDPRLDAVCRMIEEGKTVKQVLRIQVPDFDRLDTYGAYLAEKGLRAALARRIRVTIPAKNTQRSSPPK